MLAIIIAILVGTSASWLLWRGHHVGRILVGAALPMAALTLSDLRDERTVPVLSIVVIVLAVGLLWREYDVRLVLFGAGLAMATLAGVPWVVFDKFRNTMGNEQIVGPICSAMGYAYILKTIGADRQMVRLLLAPLERVKWLLVPGGCCVGFVTNMAITSQTAAAAAVGPILVPLMIAAGHHPITAAATMVLGCSGGGNLFNPGEPDVVNIAANLKSSSGESVNVATVIDAMLLPELCGFLAAVLLLTLMRGRGAAPVDQAGPGSTDDAEPVDYVRAMLPPLPIVLLFLTQPRFGLAPALAARFADGLPVPHAMLLSAIVALCVHRRDASAIARSFFEGMGYAYIHVISLIIAAGCIISGMDAAGLLKLLVGGLHGGGPIAQLLSLTCPWLLGVTSGSGTAPSVGFSQAVLPTLSGSDLYGAMNLGVLAAIGATFGRTMSPVAAVVIYTATLTGVQPLQIVKKVAPLLAAGGALVYAIMLLR